MDEPEPSSKIRPIVTRAACTSRGTQMYAPFPSARRELPDGSLRKKADLFVSALHASTAQNY